MHCKINILCHCGSSVDKEVTTWAPKSSLKYSSDQAKILQCFLYNTVHQAVESIVVVDWHRQQPMSQGGRLSQARLKRHQGDA